MDDDDRRAVALWRVAVLGPLISALAIIPNMFSRGGEAQTCRVGLRHAR